MGYRARPADGPGASANKTGHKNLEDAGSAFKEHSTTALELARDNPANLAAFQKVAELRNKQATLQAKVAALAKEDQAAAIVTLNKEETPVWREMRTPLLEFIKQKNAEVKETKAAVVDSTHRMLLISISLGIAAVLIGAGIAI